jgi:membrane protease YdiL (CAAX protease family)
MAASLSGSKLASVGFILLVILANGLDLVAPPLGVPAAVLLIWVILKLTGRGWADLGLGRPRSWRQTVLLGLGLAGAMQLLTAYGLEPLLETLGLGSPDLSRFDSLQGNIGMLALYLTVSWTTAGFGEEIIWRGFVLTGVARVLGGSKAAWAAGLAVMAILFGLLHLYQGIAGMIPTGLIGLAFGVVYLATGRNLWIPILMHATMNTISFLLLFLGVKV